MRFKKCGKILARIVPVICVVALVVSMAVPASAASSVYDYEDYVKNTVVADDGKVFTVSFPVSGARWRIWDGYNFSGTQVFDSAGSTVTFNNAIVGKDYSMALDPLGTSGFILCNNIPAGTKVLFVFNTDGTSPYENPTLGVQLLYYDSSFKQIETYTERFDVGSFGNTEVLLDLNVPDNAKYVRFQAQYFSFTPLSGDGVSTTKNLTFELSYFGLKFKVDSYYLMVQESGKQTALLGKIESELSNQGQTLDDILESQGQTNEKLDDVVDQQQQTNEKLDEVINGSEEQNKEADEIEDKTDDSLGNLESAGDALENVERPEIDADDLVPDDLFGDDYLLLVDTIKIFWTSDLITKNLTIMAGFILLALVIHGKK